MRHLVLGGGGFIGYHLVERLIQTEPVKVFDCNLGKYTSIRSPNLDLIEGNFMDCNYADLLKDIDIVWHLISTTVAANGTFLLTEEFEKNILPTIRLLEAMAVYKTPKIIFLSSGGTVYGETTTASNEDDALNPICSYGIQKMTLEKCISLYHRYHGIQTIIARLSNPYGIKQSIKRRQGVIPIFINQIAEGKAIEIWGDGSTVRDYIYIDDAVDALIALSQYNGKQSIFNIASGECISLNGLVEMVGDEMGKVPKVVYKFGRLCDVPCNRLDTKRIREECGWTAKVKLEDGIKRLLSMQN